MAKTASQSQKTAHYDILDTLYQTIKERKKADPEISYVAKLFAKGRKKIAQKIGEEAAETIIEAVANKKQAVISESADLLFHLLLLWADMGIKPEQIMKELQQREGVSGITEKRSRKS